MSLLKSIFATVVVCGALSGCSQTTTNYSGSYASSSSIMLTRGYAFAPPAFKSFCQRERSLCSTAGGQRQVALSAAREAELKAVNSQVNRQVREKSDLASVGKADDWRVPNDEGDCEDFAILKKKRLIQKGWPASALLLTVARSGGEGHTVLTVRTDKGDLILDNRTSAIKNWSRTNYDYFARQSQSNGSQWERIQ